MANGTAFSQPALATWSYWAWNKAREIYGVSMVAQGTGLTANVFSAVDGSSFWEPAPVGTCGFCDCFATSSPVTAVYNNEDLNVAATAPSETNIEMFWQVSSTDPYGYVPPWGPFNEELAGSISSWSARHGAQCAGSAAVHREITGTGGDAWRLLDGDLAHARLAQSGALPVAGDQLRL